MNREELKLLSETLCRHFRSKGMYVYGTPIPEPTADELEGDDDVAGDGYCWCLKSGQTLGPDHEEVTRLRCQPGRSCYEAPADE